jgi:hypothetical protein
MQCERRIQFRHRRKCTKCRPFAPAAIHGIWGRGVAPNSIAVGEFRALLTATCVSRALLHESDSHCHAVTQCSPAQPLSA